MRARLKKLVMENFKGMRLAEYEFVSDFVRVSGMNRLGKTTIFTAYMWLLANVDAELHSNPNIRPNGVEECIPTVTAVLDVDGKEITISKMQKRKVGKPDANGVSKVANTNFYEVNSVPKSERDFKAYLEDLGLDFDNFLVCSHPDVFTGQKQADMRKVLFKMASEKSDYDIAAMSAETADVAKLLSDYKYEEIEAMQKSSKKKAVEQVDAIPNQIIGLEKAKVDVDTAEQELFKAELERQITSLDEKIANAGSAVGDLRSEEMQLQFDMSGIMQEMNAEIMAKRRELSEEIRVADLSISDFGKLINDTQVKHSQNECEIKNLNDMKPEINRKYKENMERVFDKVPYLFDESKWVFDESSAVCSLCGQTLPEDKITALIAEFDARKKSAMESCAGRQQKAHDDFISEKERVKNKLLKEAEKIKGRIQLLTNENEVLNNRILDFQRQEEDAVAKKAELEKQLSELPEKADYSQNAEYVKLKASHDEVVAEIAKANSAGYDELVAGLKEEKAELLEQLDAAKRIIAQAENNVRIDEQISDLQEKQRDYEQAKADAEKILYQLSLVSKRKNELLVAEINQHFGIVEWKLFDYLKNSEYKEVCIPEVDGKRFGESTNTGREIEAKLDICNSFQKFFDMYIPIFLDGAESINDEYVPAVDTQLILLSVTEDKELRVEGV